MDSRRGSRLEQHCWSFVGSSKHQRKTKSKRLKGKKSISQALRDYHKKLFVPSLLYKSFRVRTTETSISFVLSFPQDSRAWPTQNCIRFLLSKSLTNPLSRTVLGAKRVTEIPSKVLNGKIQTDQKQTGKLCQYKCLNRDLEAPQIYSGAE